MGENRLMELGLRELEPKELRNNCTLLHAS